MSHVRRLAAAVALWLITRAPSGTVGRARVAGRLAPLLEKVFAALGSPLTGRVLEIAEGPAGGLKIVGERRSLAWLSGRVEPEIQSLLARELAQGGVFVDAGASVGFFSLLAARVVGPTGHVIAFEPQPAAAASIRANADLNAFRNVTVVEAALSDTDGTRILDGVGTATAHLVTQGDGATALQVDCLTLDGYLAAHERPRPTLVKVDVEGHELRVLAGMRETLAECAPTLVVELHGSAGEIVEAIERAGYVVSVVGSDDVGDARSAGASAHLFAQPRRDDAS